MKFITDFLNKRKENKIAKKIATCTIVTGKQGLIP